MNIYFVIAIAGVFIYQIIDAFSIDSDNQSKRNCRDFCKSECGINCDCKKGIAND